MKIMARVSDKDFYIPFLIFFFALFLRIAFLFNFGASLIPDSYEYLAYSRTFSETGTFGDMPLRGPLYPFFLSVCGIFGNEISLMVIIQILAGSFVSAGVYRLSFILSGKRLAGIISGLFFAVNFLEIRLLTSILSDSLFAGLIFLFMFFFIKFDRHSTIAGALSAGLVLGLSSLIRNSLPGFVLFSAVFIFYGKKDLKNLRLPVLVFIFTYSLMTVPWMVRNKVRNDFFGITASAGLNLMTHAVNGDYIGSAVPESVPAVDSLLKDYEDILNKTVGPRKGMERIDWRKMSIPHETLRKLHSGSGYSVPEASALEFDYALSAVFNDPGGYLKASMIELYRILFVNEEYYPKAGELAGNLFTDSSLPYYIRSFLRTLISFRGFFIIIFSIIFILTLPRRREAFFIVFTVFFSFLVCSFFSTGLTRYKAAAGPLLSCIYGHGIAICYYLCRRRKSDLP
ncbi:MAG: hypothetical protein ACLFQK_01095 [Fibrobacterota bacterium]